MVKAKQKHKLSNDGKKSKQKKELEYLQDLSKQVQEFEGEAIKGLQKFEELPISESTKAGLKASHFMDLRDIQRATIVPALQGNDILGAAQTGSGKTLAFLIPVLEKLYLERWTDMDGLGALILSPTRELAIQTFEVLKKIGRRHQFSAALVVGGNDAKTESERLSRVNILIGTPGRVLHHMHRSSQLDVSNIQSLVLDEADRILDEGFQRDVDSILQDLPPGRQTLLFSATQTKKVKDLARLSLTDPMYISTHAVGELASTPKTLDQFYIVCEDYEKLNNLFAFIKSHLKSKMIIFFASVKQVRFVFETFRKMQPGVPLMQLFGKQKQTARIENTEKFKATKHACLFTTDIIARGIDIPSVDWVVQVDVAEDLDTYIHRVGRSARNERKGKSLLFLTGKEEKGFVAELEGRKIPISKQNVRQGRKKDITVELQKICYEEPEIKVLGQKALQTYVQSIHKRKHADLFNYRVADIPMEKYAKSLGLPSVPNVKRFKDLDKARSKKNVPRALLAEDEEEQDREEKKKVRTKYDRLFERKNQGVFAEDYMKLQEDNKPFDFGDEDGDFMSVKANALHEDMEEKQLDDNSKGNNLDESENENGTQPESKRAMKRALSKKLSLKDKGSASKLVFDDEGNPHQLYEFEDEEDFKAAGDADVQKQEFLSKESEVMQTRDVEDKEVARQKRQEKKRKRQEIERRLREMEESGGATVAMLPSDVEQEDAESDQESDREPQVKKRKWFQKDDSEDEEDGGVLEVDEPETLEDLEALSSKLIGR